MNFENMTTVLLRARANLIKIPLQHFVTNWVSDGEMHLFCTKKI